MYDALLANVIISVQLNGVLKSERAYSDAYLSQAMCNHAKKSNGNEHLKMPTFISSWVLVLEEFVQSTLQNNIRNSAYFADSV